MSAAEPAHEWFARPDAPEGGDGLRFSCTMCGNCCTGVPGYVLIDDAETAALARRVRLSVTDFLDRFTHVLEEGRSLTERKTSFGFDCVFLDRESIPGKAVCGVYEDRPKQCRTWPFWPSNLSSRRAWLEAKRKCPGIDHGPVTPLTQIRVLRDSCKI
ncbi:MAG: YkgJ family cysteine cluster protein [Phycisphaerales bacterium]